MFIGSTMRDQSKDPLHYEGRGGGDYHRELHPSTCYSPYWYVCLLVVIVHTLLTDVCLLGLVFSLSSYRECASINLGLFPDLALTSHCYLLSKTWMVMFHHCAFIAGISGHATCAHAVWISEGAR